MEISAVIFDVDGLMLDTERVVRKSLQRAASEYGYTISDNLYLELIGRTIPRAEAHLRDALGDSFPLEDVRQLQRSFTTHTITTEGISLKPGLHALLTFLDGHAVLKGVATSTYREEAQRRLSIAGIAHAFDTFVFGEDVENGKPAPDIYLKASQQIGIDPEHCMVLEDSDVGIEAAHAAGAIPILVPDLKPPSPKAAALAYRVLSSLEDVRRLLEETLLAPS
jgi:HAD superfamily hydrolase (TIGR01509 family)